MKNLMVCLVVIAGCGSSANQGVTGENPDATTSDIDAHTGSDVDAAATPDGPTVCTADTQNDPNNCGLCGRSCLGGACSMGRCEATRLDAGDISGIGDFATDGLFMYYAGFTTGTGANNRIWRLVIGPATTEDYVDVLSSAPLTQMAFDGTYFFTANPYTLNSTNYSQIRRATKMPFGATILQMYEPATTTATYTQGGYVYWATDINTSSGEIHRMSTAGGSIETVTAVAGTVHYMIGDSTNLYWVDNARGGLQPALRKAPIAGGPPVQVLAGVADFVDADASNLYLVKKTVQNGTGPLLAISKANGATTTLAQNMSTGGAVDDEFVYAAKDNQLIGVTKTGTSLGVLWERAAEGTSGCPTVMKIARAKVIGDYVYFLVKPTTCDNTELNNAIYRLPRL